MKTKTIYALTGLVTILSVARVDAATIFAPTDGDVNFLPGDLLGAQLAIFDDSDQSYLGPSLGVQIGDIVRFASINGFDNHTVTNTSNAASLLLTGSTNFILGLSTDGGVSWMADAGPASLGANAYSVTFGTTGANVIEVDVQIVPAVPVPAAVWLFGSGLLGLVGIARRKALLAQYIGHIVLTQAFLDQTNTASTAIVFYTITVLAFFVNNLMYGSNIADTLL